MTTWTLVSDAILTGAAKHFRDTKPTHPPVKCKRRYLLGADPESRAGDSRLRGCSRFLLCPLALGESFPSALGAFSLIMSENLPACKYWHEAGMTGCAALNRKETAGQKESCTLPTRETTCFQSPQGLVLAKETTRKISSSQKRRK